MFVKNSMGMADTYIYNSHNEYGQYVMTYKSQYDLSDRYNGYARLVLTYDSVYLLKKHHG